MSKKPPVRTLRGSTLNSGSKENNQTTAVLWQTLKLLDQTLSEKTVRAMRQKTSRIELLKNLWNDVNASQTKNASLCKLLSYFVMIADAKMKLICSCCEQNTGFEKIAERGMQNSTFLEVGKDTSINAQSDEPLWMLNFANEVRSSSMNVTGFEIWTPPLVEFSSNDQLVLQTEKRESSQGITEGQAKDLNGQQQFKKRARMIRTPVFPNPR